MLAFGIVCAMVAAASAGYASSSAGGAGLYNTNTYSGQNYGSKYPYSNQYSGFASAGGQAGGAFPYYQPFAPLPPFASPYDFQNAFQQYYNQLSSLNANARHLTTSYAGEGASVSARASLGPSHYKSSIDENQAYGGAGAGAYGGAGAGGYGGASTGSYGGVGAGGTYGGTYGGGQPNYAPNYASSGGYVGNGYQQQHASIYPANPARPNLDSRFGGDDSPVGVTHTQSGGPGFVGVSSFSSSSDINGVRNRESATSVNNNGKVTTYHTRN